MIAAEARGAWRELEAKLRPYVSRRVAAKADVDDVVQEVLVRLHRGATGLRDDERFGGWVYRIAEHAVVDHLRARARHPLAGVSSLEPSGELADTAAGEDNLAAELSECVALFVSRLRSPYREAVTLTELQGRTQKEGADLLGISLSGMKSRVQRGREQIRRMFEECCEISLDARGHVVDCTPRPLEHREDVRRGAAQCSVSRRPS